MLELLLVIIVVALAAVLVLNIAQEEEGLKSSEDCEEQNGEICPAGCLPEDKIGVVHEGVHIWPCCKKGRCS